jgi:hypothetical protein
MTQQDYIPLKMALEADIQRCIAKYHDPLVGDMESSVRDTIVQMCDRELDSIALRFQSSLDQHVTFVFLVAKLHLFTLALVQESQHLPDRRGFEPHSLCAKLQHLGMSAAHRIIDAFCERLERSAFYDASLIDPHRALPKVYFRGVLTSTFFLLKYFVLNKACQDEEKAAARNKVLLVHAKLRDVSPHPLAELGRAAAVIEVLCRHADPETVEIGAEVEDRAAASITWSALISAADIRGRRNVRAGLLERINPTSPTARSHDPPQTGHEMPGQTGVDPADESPPFPDDIWDQSFVEMLDFSAYDFDQGVEYGSSEAQS